MVQPCEEATFRRVSKNLAAGVHPSRARLLLIATRNRKGLARSGPFKMPLSIPLSETAKLPYVVAQRPWKRFRYESGRMIAAKGCSADIPNYMAKRRPRGSNA